MSHDNVIPLFVTPSPEVRAQVIGEVVRHVASVAAQVTYTAVVAHVLKALDMREELVGPEIINATSALIRAGVLTCNRFDPTTSEILYCADTCVGLGPAMMGYIWAEETFVRGDAEA